jgi:hypothetical protein
MGLDRNSRALPRDISEPAIAPPIPPTAAQPSNLVWSIKWLSRKNSFVRVYIVNDAAPATARPIIYPQLWTAYIGHVRTKEMVMRGIHSPL